jgi:hypothetical protein
MRQCPRRAADGRSSRRASHHGGVASDDGIDADRCRVLPYSLLWKEPPPLLFKHKEPAGRILSLEWRDRSLMIMAWVSRPLGSAIRIVKGICGRYIATGA